MKLILKIILIALLLFFSKHFVQVIIEWTDFIPVRPKANVWGNWDTSLYNLNWQFVFTSWVYLIAVILAYFMLKSKFLSKFKYWQVLLVLSGMIFLFLLYVYRFEFPKKQLYFPSRIRFNYELLADFITYTIVGALLIYFVRKKLINLVKAG